MSVRKPSLSEKLEKIKEIAQKLPDAAANINLATDSLGKSIIELDSLLKKYSLGVPTWVSFHESRDDNAGCGYLEQVGYAKVSGKWGIAIRTIDYDIPHENVEQWLFNDSPRLLRVEAVEKIPELLEAVIHEAAKMSLKIEEKTAEVAAYTQSIREALKGNDAPVATKLMRAMLETPEAK